MKFTSAVVSAFVALVASVSAVPASDSPAARTDLFRLKSILISGKKTYDNLYLQPSHVGAGFNALVFNDNATDPFYFRLNGTRLVANIQSTPETAVQLNGPEDLEAGWGTTSADITPGTTGFALNKTGAYLINQNTKVAWNGWRICNWVHGGPELFWDYKDSPFADYVPGSCAQVLLTPQYF